MKTNIAALLLCICILVTVSLTASAQDSSNAVPSSNATTVTEPIPTTKPSGTTVTEPVVTAENLSKCTITLSSTSYKFSGVEKKPKVTVRKGKQVFSKSDYTVTYKNNLNAGTGKVIVTAKQNSKVLKGSVTKYFKIEKKELSTMRYKTLSADSFVYNGKEFKPTLKLSGDVLKLSLNKDYTITYKNNKEVGIATVTATGKGNYKGTYSKTFMILPKKVTGIKASNIKSTTFKLSWNKVSGNIDGYRIYRYNSATKSYDYAVSTKNTYFNVSGREAATSYTYLVRAYYNSGD